MVKLNESLGRNYKNRNGRLKKEESGLESLSSYDPRRSLNTHYDRHLVAYIGDL